MVNGNYQIASRHFSYSVLRNQLTAILRAFFGDTVETLSTKEPYTKAEGYLHINPHIVMYKHDDTNACGLRG